MPRVQESSRRYPEGHNRLLLYCFDPLAEDRRLIASKKFNLERQFEMARVWNAFGAERRLEAVLSVGSRCCLEPMLTRPASYSPQRHVRCTSGRYMFLGIPVPLVSP